MWACKYPSNLTHVFLFPPIFFLVESAPEFQLSDSHVQYGWRRKCPWPLGHSFLSLEKGSRKELQHDFQEIQETTEHTNGKRYPSKWIYYWYYLVISQAVSCIMRTLCVCVLFFKLHTSSPKPWTFCVCYPLYQVIPWSDSAWSRLSSMHRNAQFCLLCQLHGQLMRGFQGIFLKKCGSTKKRVPVVWPEIMKYHEAALWFVVVSAISRTATTQEFHTPMPPITQCRCHQIRNYHSIFTSILYYSYASVCPI